MAVRQKGHALQFAAAELQADREIVATAVSEASDALEYACADLLLDHDFWLDVRDCLHGRLILKVSLLSG
eukprot:526107-Amphidinium_carterae.1